MDWQLEDEWFCVCSNIQRGWISHVYSRRYAAKIYLPGHLLGNFQNRFGVYPTMGACLLALLQPLWYLLHYLLHTFSFLIIMSLCFRDDFNSQDGLSTSNLSVQLSFVITLSGCMIMIKFWLTYYVRLFPCCFTWLYLFCFSFLSFLSPLQEMVRCMFGT